MSLKEILCKNHTSVIKCMKLNFMHKISCVAFQTSLSSKCEIISLWPRENYKKLFFRLRHLNGDELFNFPRADYYSINTTFCVEKHQHYNLAYFTFVNY